MMMVPKRSEFSEAARTAVRESLDRISQAMDHVAEENPGPALVDGITQPIVIGEKKIVAF